MATGDNVCRMDGRPELHDVKDAATLLRISRRTLDRYIAEGRIAAVKIGRSVYVTQAEINDFWVRELAEAARMRAARARASRKRAA